MKITNIDGSQLHLNDAMLDHCAEAMYKIREPKGSTRVPFLQLTDGKKIANRRVAREVLQTATLAWSRSSVNTDPNSIFDLVGDDLYRRMAPNKSQLNPWDGRSNFAKDYYRNMARTYLYDVLKPYASGTPSSYRVSAPQSRDALTGNHNGTNNRLVGGRSNALPQPERAVSRTPLRDSNAHAGGNGIPVVEILPPEMSPKAPEPTGAQSAIALLLIVIVLLLVFILVALVR